MSAITCRHWREPADHYRGTCALGLFHEGRPTFGICALMCDKREPDPNPAARDLLAAMREAAFPSHAARISGCCDPP